MEPTIVTGYFKNGNTGDDLFMKYALKLFKNMKIIQIEELHNYDFTHVKKIVLFGGEVLNSYFLNPLIKIKDKNQNIKLYAIGVSVGQDINELTYSLHMFQYVVCRSSADYALIKNNYPNITVKYIQDISFLKKPKYFNISIKHKNSIGLFLSKPKNEDARSLIYNLKLNGFKVYLFSMCYNDKPDESDYLMNEKLSKETGAILVEKDKLYTEIRSIKYAICERFHSHILCMCYGIPFISFANTIKVYNLLKDLELSYLLHEKYNSIKITFDTFNSINMSKIKDTYNKIHKDVMIYDKLSHYSLDDFIDNYPKYKVQQFISESTIHTYCKDIINLLSQNKISAKEILMKLFGTCNNNYLWGIEQKLHNLPDDDIYYLFHKSFIQSPFLMNRLFNIHYTLNNQSTLNNHSIHSIHNIIMNKSINIDYINQYDNTGCHRSGWKYVTDAISNNLASYNSDLLCDLYIDRTFHWNREQFKKAGIIPYKSNWIGFIHHTLWKDPSGYNCIELFECVDFIASLEYCKGLIVLSEYLKNQLEILTKDMNHIPIFVLHHPTEFVDTYWSSKLWNKDLVQIGSWMRNNETIFKIPYEMKKILLTDNKKCISFSNEESYIELLDLCKYTSIEYIDRLSNDEYDDLLTKCVVFIDLYDASAVNTIIECIVRNTPIIVNKLPAVVEYLGSNYPLYFTDVKDINEDNLLNINNIKKANKYLKSMNKDFLRIDNFIDNLNKIISKII